MPYTIVLTPPAEYATKYIEASQALYSEYDPHYLLENDGTSSPHITVVQFECESAALVQQVWEKTCEIISKQRVLPFAPPFTGVAFVEGVGLYVNTTWVELSIKRGDVDSPIMKVHQAALEALKLFGLKPLNACDNDYRPHLTLARIRMPEQMQTWSKFLYENPGEFNLELGLSDQKWQYAKTLKSFPLEEK
jgi:2'-5' RNA ligase